MNAFASAEAATPLALDTRIRRVPTLLADGRELIYFDDADTVLGGERRADQRVLDERPDTASMRQDPLTGEWVSVAATRQNRAHLPPARFDPLAPQSADNPSEIPNVYDVAVFENRSPSFGPGLGDLTDAAAEVAELRAVGIARTKPSIGRCEVVCFSPDHDGSLGTQRPSRIRTIVEAWAERTAALSALPGVQQVFPFENRGEAIGVTLHHPHGQIYAYPYITPRSERVLASAAAYRERTGSELFADILESERASERVLLADEHFTAFVPFAARWPIEIHLMPHRHIPDLAATTLAERDELATLLPRLLRGVDALYDSPTPYILAWHQAPIHVGRNDVRLTMQLTSPRRAADRLKFLAGSEAAMGAWIGDISPEAGAAALRAAIEKADAAV